MAVNDFTGQNIQDTYQKVIQTDGTNIADGTGSLLPISFDGNNAIISGSLTASEYSVTSSVTNVVFQQQSGSTIFGDSLDDTHKITGSLDITGSILGQQISLTSLDPDPSIILKETTNDFESSITQTSLKLLINANDSATQDINFGTHGRQNSLVLNGNGNIGFATYVYDSSSMMSINGDVYVNSHITASANISASGDIIANTLTGIIDGGTF